MNTNDVLDEFRKVGALLEGHFILSSGRRSPVFLQKALVFSHPKTTEKLCGRSPHKLKPSSARSMSWPAPPLAA
jgi:orotate phosphoribosyltransferase